jgi:hypothetical protein
MHEEHSVSRSSSVASDDSEQSPKRQLLEFLESVNTSGSFATSHNTSLFPNPGLHIDGLGQVSLPLTQRDAEAIAEIGKQAPFGRGRETVVDTSV